MRDPTRPLRHLELHPLMPDTIWADNPECFATRELRRYLRLTTGRDWPPAKTPEAAAVVLSLAGLAGAAAESAVSDWFKVTAAVGRFTITGANPRSLLYGVYAFLERVGGIRFFAPDHEVVPACQVLDLSVVGSYGETARFRWRQLRLEWGLGAPMVDWAAKQRFNAI